MVCSLEGQNIECVYHFFVRLAVREGNMCVHDFTEAGEFLNIEFIAIPKERILVWGIGPPSPEAIQALNTIMTYENCT